MVSGYYIGQCWYGLCLCYKLEWATSLYLKVIQPKLLSSLIQKKVFKKKKNTNSEMYERQKLKAFQFLLSALNSNVESLQILEVVP